MAMTKTDWIAARAKAAKDLGLKEAKDQKAHTLLATREYKRLAEEHGDDWKAIHNAIMSIGHGFACNASQFNQWLDKAEGGVKTEVLADLEV